LGIRELASCQQFEHRLTQATQLIWERAYGVIPDAAAQGNGIIGQRIDVENRHPGSDDLDGMTGICLDDTAETGFELSTLVFVFDMTVERERDFDGMVGVKARL